MSQRPHAHFGFWTGWFVVIASMVGSGILTNSGPVLKNSGSYTGLILVWACGGVLALAGAWTLAELASAFPRAGGDYAYVKEAFGSAWGFTYGWAMSLLSFAAPIALVAYTAANYCFPFLRDLFPALAGQDRAVVVAMATLLITGFTFSHCLSHRQSSGVQNGMTIFNLAILSALVVLCLFSPAARFSNFSVGRPMAETSWSTWGSNLILVLYAYTGWNGAGYLSGEMKDPTHTLPRTLVWGCASVTLFYILVNVAYAVTLSPTAIAKLTANESQRLAEVSMEVARGAFFARAFSLLISLGMFAALSAFILTGARIGQAMALDGLYPRFAGKLDPRTHLPVRALLLQGAIALVMLWSGSFEQILNFTGYGVAVLGILIVAPIFVLRRRAGYKPRVRVPLYPLLPLLFLLVSVVTLAVAFKEQPVSSALSLGTILSGFLIYFLIKRFEKKPTR